MIQLDDDKHWALKIKPAVDIRRIPRDNEHILYPKRNYKTSFTAIYSSTLVCVLQSDYYLCTVQPNTMIYIYYCLVKKDKQV